MSGHTSHVHSEWYDRGGDLRAEHGPEIVCLHSPEPVLTAKQWADIKHIADQK